MKAIGQKADEAINRFDNERAERNLSDVLLLFFMTLQNYLN